MAIPTITIADELSPLDKPEKSSQAGGIYRTRSHDARARSASRSSQERSDQTGDVEDEEDWNRDDGRKKQVFKGTTLLW